MVAVQEMDSLRDLPGTHGPVAGPRLGGGMAPKCSPKLLNPPREAMWSPYCRHRSSVSVGMGLLTLDGCVKCQELAPRRASQWQYG
jgi:hypothetical protein